MFGIGGTELVIILLFAFLIVGPDRLPEIAKTLGKAVAKFRETQDSLNDAVKKETDAIKEEAAKAKRKQEAEERKARVAAEAAAAASAAAGPGAETAETLEESKKVAETVEAKPESEQKTLSFTERKAAYEREQAAKAQAAKEEAEAKAQSESDAGSADSSETEKAGD